MSEWAPWSLVSKLETRILLGQKPPNVAAINYDVRMQDVVTYRKINDERSQLYAIKSVGQCCQSGRFSNKLGKFLSPGAEKNVLS